MPCMRTPSTSSTPKALDPTHEISLKYNGDHSQRSGAWTPLLTMVPRCFRRRTPISAVCAVPTVS